LFNATLVPASVRGCLDVAGLNHRPILFSVHSDIGLDGKCVVHWLVVTRDHLSVVDQTTDSVVRSVNWTDVEKVRTNSGTGSGMLQVKLVDDGWVDLIRFSNALAGRFHKVSRRLEVLREKDRSDEAIFDNGMEEGEPLDPPRCPSCQLRLSHSHEACPRCLQKGQILRRVTELLRPYMRGAIFLTLLTVLGVAAELIPPKLQQHLVDNILGPKAADNSDANFTTALLVVVLALAASRIVLSAVGVVKGRLATVIGTGLTSTLRSQMVQKLQQLAVVYYDRHQIGSTLSRVAHDSEVLHGMLHQITGGFLLQTVQLVGVGAMLVWLNPKLAMYTLIPVPLVFLGSWIFWQKVYPRYYRLWDASSKQMSALNGMLSGIRVVKAFAQEDREYQKFQSANEHLRHWRLWVDNTNATYSAAMQLVFSLGGLIVWYVGGRDVIGHEMTLGQLIAFLAYLAMFYAPLSALSNFTTWLTSFLSGSKRVLELLDTPLTIPDASNPVPWDNPRGAIRFDRVTFGYDRNQPVVKDVSFEVKPGEMIGIVGRSGSGKTTMVNLLSRFYDVQEGAIEIDGIDIRQLSMQHLRQHLGIVFQDSFLFRGTIWKNLSYGRPSTSIEDGIQAARAAGAHDFICRTQLGYETLLGEHGAGLSGGEKQRLSIARTLLYDPQILILDEATSNIDAESEKSIQEALEVLTKGRTTVAIAHRLSTLRNADRILVFDRGQLVEQGSHSHLLSIDGTYARLVRIQTQVSKDQNVDRLLHAFESPQDNSNLEVSIAPKDGLAKQTDGTQRQEPAREPKRILPPKQALHWLNPAEHCFRLGELGQLELWRSDEKLGSGLFILRTFPASHPTQYLSVRGWNSDGEEIELGMIRHIQEWSERDRIEIQSALDRRYLLREIKRINDIDLKFGFVDFDVETETGQAQFSMRWTQSQAIDYGNNGKLIIDTEENRYLVRDIASLPPADREKFLQYVYW
jgi:ATP-binding cassette, subfamily B, bacterial